jgi:hypothetical protein
MVYVIQICRQLSSSSRIRIRMGENTKTNYVAIKKVKVKVK